MKVVSSKEEFDALITNYELSSAPIDLIEKAIRELKLLNPQFDDKLNKAPSEELAKAIKDGESDISDMGGN